MKNRIEVHAGPGEADIRDEGPMIRVDQEEDNLLPWWNELPSMDPGSSPDPLCRNHSGSPQSPLGRSGVSDGDALWGMAVVPRPQAHGSAHQARLQALLHHKSLEDEQSVVLGRLTSRVCHSISNSLQALRGALTLALEEPGVPEQVVSYLELCQSEVQREVDLVTRVREVYRPVQDSGPIALEPLLAEVVALSSDEVERHGHELQVDLASDLPAVHASASLLRLVFLDLILRIKDLCVLLGGSGVRLEAHRAGSHVDVDLSMLGASLPADNGRDPSEMVSDLMEAYVTSSAVAGWLKSACGRMALVGAPGRIEVRVELRAWSGASK